MSYEYIRTERDARLFVITIDRPDALNALNPATNFELAQAFDEFEKDPGLWVAIITGSGERSFSVGGDISVMVEAKTEEDYCLPPSGYGGLTERYSCCKPIIAAVNGLALGGGFEIALACDLVIAAEAAQFGLPEPLIGTAAVGGGMQRLVRAIGLKPAMELLLTGRSIDAAQALRIGLVNRVVPLDGLMDTARTYARWIMKCAPLAVQATKQCAMQGLDYGSAAEAIRAQRDGRFERLQTMLHSNDIREGLRAFMEKRKPVWQGN